MSNIAKHDPEPFIIDPEPTPLGQAAAIICGHPVIQAFGVEGMCAFHGFVQEVLATEVEPELERKDREIERLHERLEDNHEFELKEDGRMVRVEVAPGSIPDGIECRDETIKLQDEANDKLRAHLKEADELLEVAYYAHQKMGLEGRGDDGLPHEVRMFAMHFSQPETPKTPQHVILSGDGRYWRFRLRE